MRLTELKGAFYRTPGPRRREFLTRPTTNPELPATDREADPDAFAQADGVFFICPRCLAAGGEEHGILIRFAGRAAWEAPGARHTASGTSLADLTLAEPIQFYARAPYGRPPLCAGFGPLYVNGGAVIESAPGKGN